MEPPDYEAAVPFLGEQNRNMGIGVQAEEFGSADYNVPYTSSAISHTTVGQRLINVRHAPYSRSNHTALSPADNQMNGVIAPRIAHQQRTTYPPYDPPSSANSHSIDLHASRLSYPGNDSTFSESVGSHISGMLESRSVPHASVSENSVLFSESASNQIDEVLVPRSVPDASIPRYSALYPSSSNPQAIDNHGPRTGLPHNYIENELAFLESTISHMNELLESRRTQQQDTSISRQNNPLPTPANSQMTAEPGYCSVSSSSYPTCIASYSTSSNHRVIDHHGSTSVLSNNYPIQRDYAAFSESTNRQISRIPVSASVQPGSVPRYSVQTSSSFNHQAISQPISRNAHCTNCPDPVNLTRQNMAVDWTLSGESVAPNTTTVRYSAFHPQLHSTNRQAISDCGFSSVISGAIPRRNISRPIPSNCPATNAHISRNVLPNTYPVYNGPYLIPSTGRSRDWLMSDSQSSTTPRLRASISGSSINQPSGLSILAVAPPAAITLPMLSSSLHGSSSSQASSRPIFVNAPSPTITLPRFNAPFPDPTSAPIGSIHSRTMRHTVPLYNPPYLVPSAERSGNWLMSSSQNSTTPIRPHHQHLPFPDVLPSYEQALSNMNSHGHAASFRTLGSANINQVIRYVSNNQNVSLIKVQDIQQETSRKQLIETHTVTYKYNKISNSPEGEECIICFIEYENGDDVRRLPCLHFFHKDCIDTWLLTGCRELKVSCPCCRMNIGQPHISSM